MSKLTAMRALTARFGRRAVRIVTIIAAAMTVVSLLIIWSLAHFFSPWWWLLLIPMIVFVVLVLIVRTIAVFILSRIHGEPITTRQQEALDAFIDKIQQLIEARATPPWVFAVLTIKDIILHRDITTIKKLVNDSTGLRNDYADLAKLFE